MLSAEHRAIVKATVPLLESGGEALTTHFYRDARRISRSAAAVQPGAQASGEQPRALANGVLMYARHIDRLEALGDLVGADHQQARRAANPAGALSDRRRCLLRAIREVLGAEIATDAVIEAWAAAYGQLADMLIGRRKASTASANSAGRLARRAALRRRAQGSGKRRDHVVLSRAGRRRRGARLPSGPVHRPAPDHRRRGTAPQLFAVGRAERPRLPHQREARSRTARCPTSCTTTCTWATRSKCSRPRATSCWSTATSRWC